MSNRSINSDIWHHPFFRKYPWFVRETFIYLFSAAADDEGRFLADVENILEDCFPRSYPVSSDDVKLALSVLHEGGLLCLYGDDRQYGFCTGWFEHQKLDKRYRDESSHPAPPVLISSWQQADSIKEKYIKERNMAGCNVRYDDAIRWYTGLIRDSETQDSRETRELLAGDSRVSAGDSRETRAQPNLTQPNLKNDSATPAEHPAVVAADLVLQTEKIEQKQKQKQPRKTPQTPHVLFAEALWVLFQQELPCPGEVVKAAGQFINAHGHDCTEEFIRWLQSSSLAVVPEGAKPETYIAKTIREGNNQSFRWKEDNKPQKHNYGSVVVTPPHEMGNGRVKL